MVLNMADAGSIDLASNMQVSESHEVINVSDLEEGEINDASDLDVVSEVSTDEELLLRQRIKILENYNSALGKKQARLRSSQKDKKNCLKTTRLDVKSKLRKSPLANLIVIDDVDDQTPYAKFKEMRRHIKSPRRHKRPHHRKSGISHKVPEKKPKKTAAATEVKSSSSDSDCENTLKQKRILREAIGISTKKMDSSSLRKRLLHLMKGSNDDLKRENHIFEEKFHLENNVSGFIETHISTSILSDRDKNKEDFVGSVSGAKSTGKAKGEIDTAALIDQQCETMVESPEVLNTKDNCTSDDEAETLRQLALNSKSIRRNNPTVSPPNITQPNGKVDEAKAESTDSDTAELRMIALKSAMLKKASERKKLKKDIMKKNMKRNVKRKRKSVSKIISDDGIDDVFLSYLSNDNNTDVETIDMDIDMEPCKSPLIETHIQIPLDPAEQLPYALPTDYQENPNYQYLFNDFQYYDSNNYIHQPMKLNDSFSIPLPAGLPEMIEETIAEEENDVEEDEDILRALLLNSISKKVSIQKTEEVAKPSKLPEGDTKSIEPNVEAKTSGGFSDSGLIIRLGESDSGSECETTKNLTKMHHKLTNHSDFQRNLDLYLKIARSKFENASPPRVKQIENTAAKKHTPMAVRHLPKENQDEYRQLVKRMSELEKVRMARQLAQKKSSNPEKNNLLSPVKPESKDSARVVTPSSSRTPNGMNVDRSLQILAPSGMEIQLDMSRRKITNQMKILEQLESEGKGLREKTESLTAQLQAVTTQLRGSRIALNNNQRTVHVAHRNLVRLRKQHHILLNRIKSAPKTKVGSLAITIQQNVGSSSSTAPVKSGTLPITKDDASVNPNPLKTKSIIPNNPQGTEIQTKPPASKQIVTKKLPPVSGKGVQNENPPKLPSFQSSYSKTLVKCTEQSNIKIIANSTECPVPNKNDEICEIKPSLVIVNESINEGVTSHLTTKQNTGILDKEPSNDNLVPSCNSIESEDTFKDQFPAHKELKHVSTQPDIFLNNMPENTQIQVDEQKNAQINILEKNNCKETVCDKGVKSIECIETKDECAPIISPPEMGIQFNVLFKDPQEEDNTENCTNHLPTVISMEHSVKDKHVDLVEPACREYKSPLYVLKAKNNWSENPQAIFCPFEVGGSCKDPDCQYLHPRP